MLRFWLRMFNSLLYDILEIHHHFIPYTGSSVPNALFRVCNVFHRPIVWRCIVDVSDIFDQSANATVAGNDILPQHLRKIVATGLAQGIDFLFKAFFKTVGKISLRLPSPGPLRVNTVASEKQCLRDSRVSPTRVCRVCMLKMRDTSSSLLDMVLRYMPEVSPFR